MKIIKNVIFDCDGVLVDSEIIANRVETEIKNELGIAITLDEQIETFTGLSFNHPIVVAELARLPKDYWQLVDDRVKVAYEKDLKAIAGVITFLECLVAPKCVASGSEPVWLDFKLSLTGLKRYFANEAIFSTHEVARGKPAPDVFLHAMNRLGWRAEETLVIEDSAAGVQAGRAAELTVCGFLGGGHIREHSESRLREAGAAFCVRDLNEIFSRGILTARRSRG